MSSPTLIIGDGNWAVRSGSLLGYEYGELSGQFAPIPITGSRASIATYTNQSGLIVSASSGVLRVDYSTGTGSLLLEPQRTNLALQSETFDNASWTKLNSSITANTTTAPDGTNTADTLTDDSVNNVHRVNNTTNINVVSGTAYTYSVFIKNNNIDYAILKVFSGSNFAILVNLLSQTVSSTSGSVTSKIEIFGDWIRCSMTFTAASTTATVQIATSDGTMEASGNSSYIGSGKSCYIWGAQLEVGAYPTTYIPTTSTTVTRITDTFSRPNIYTDGIITSAGGTWLVELRNNIVYTRDSSGVSIDIGDGTGNSLYFAVLSTGRLQLRKRVSNVETILYTTLTDTIKVAIKWNGTSADIFVNGVKVVSATAFTTTNMEFLNGNTIDVPKYIQQMKLYNQPLSDAECTSLTTL